MDRNVGFERVRNTREGKIRVFEYISEARARGVNGR
jgi:hypothetical protein